MIRIASQSSSNRPAPKWHPTFLKLLPAIQAYATAAFAHLDLDAQEEAVAEAVAHAMVAVISLVQRGKDPTAFEGCIARFAVLRVKAGRPVAGQSLRDALSPMARQQKGFEVHSLDDETCDPGTGWKAAATADTRRWPVPDVVSFRVDFEEWLNGLPRREKQIAERLAVGDRPGQVARRFRLSPSRISQLRRALRESWAEFEGEEAACTGAAVAMA